jgi:predicted MFS family arabinose efflux permease
MLLRPSLSGTMGLLFLTGVLTSPLTIWAQSLRMRIIPPDLRGRVFSILRTTMQAGEPLGGAAGGAALAAAGVGARCSSLAPPSASPALSGYAIPPWQRMPTPNDLSCLHGSALD